MAFITNQKGAGAKKLGERLGDRMSQRMSGPLLSVNRLMSPLRKDK